MTKDDSIFWSLLRAGLWGHEDSVASDSIDWKQVMRFAHKQSVVALVADGIGIQRAAGKIPEIPSEVRNAFLRKAYSIEKTNLSINSELAKKSSFLSENGITAVQVKGQGLGRNYPHPLRRMPGDIDYLFDAEGYTKAKNLLAPLATKLDTEYPRIMHYGMFFGKIEIELHGTLHSHLGKKYDRVIDRMQEEMFLKKNFRTYKEGETTILIPSIDFDATFIFAHIVQHLYDFGLVLKQVCDWAMLLHAHHSEIDLELLRSRIEELGIMKEWKVLSCMISNKLGLPEEEIPFYDNSFMSKGEKLWKAMKSDISEQKPFKNRMDKKFKNMCRRTAWFARILPLFPANTIRSFAGVIAGGTKTFMDGK